MAGQDERNQVRVGAEMPGSEHVDAGGLDEPGAVVVETGEHQQRHALPAVLGDAGGTEREDAMIHAEGRP